ncbi:MAG TPA: hypothetical protein VMT45_13335 [Thermoanaerobaculaceae bacterium]|jgi:hypothetical protein|nr:hypothetical protein [Thermoanaerobaculaceae bacterium]
MVDAVNVASVPPKRVWWRAGALALPFFILGVAVGAYFVHHHYARVQPGFLAMFNEHMLGQYAQLQYQEASYPEAKAALERYLKLLLDPTPSPNPLSDARARRVDAVLTLGRLALLHERNGHADLADSCWARAEALAHQGTWKDPSREHLRSLVQRLDAPAPPPPATPTPKAGA